MQSPPHRIFKNGVLADSVKPRTGFSREVAKGAKKKIFAHFASSREILST